MGFPLFVFFVLLGTLQSIIGAPPYTHPFVKLAYDGHQDRPDENSLVRIASNLIPLAFLPEHLTTSLLMAHEANAVPAAIRNLARAFFNNTKAMSECCHPNMNLKDMHLCLLRLSGMNPAYLRTFTCMTDYRRWMHWLPTGRYKEESSLKLWRMKSFKENLLSFGNKTLKDKFSECEGIVAMTSVSTIFETVYAQNANENLVQVFREYHKLLHLVIIPEHYEGVPILGQIVYIILRHFSRSNYLQKVLDAMSTASQIWEAFPVALLRSILQQEAQRWTPQSQSIFEDDLEPETSEADFPVWWTEKLYPYWWHHSFLTRVNLLLAIASVEYIPEDTAALNLIYSPNHPLSMPSFPKLIEWIVAIRIKDMVSTIIELDESFRTENGKVLWDWRSHKAALFTTLPRLKCFTSIFPKKAIIFPPELLDMKMLAYYLMENKSFPLEIIVVLLHHDKSEIFDMILRELCQAGRFIPLNVILERIWSTKLSLGCKFSSLGRDLKKILGVPHSITVNGPLRDLKSEVANVMVARVRNLGGEDFAQLRAPNLAAFPTCISFLDLIISLLKTSVSFALWLYAHAQNFEGPDVVFQGVTSFQMLHGYCLPALRDVRLQMPNESWLKLS